jgi:hypothetical protein
VYSTHFPSERSILTLDASQDSPHMIRFDRKISVDSVQEKFFLKKARMHPILKVIIMLYHDSGSFH